MEDMDKLNNNQLKCQEVTWRSVRQRSLQTDTAKNQYNTAGMKKKRHKPMTGNNGSYGQAQLWSTQKHRW